jgi:small subunit ribosomal protein S21
VIQVNRKDSKESLENLIRRFNKRVQQAGVMNTARNAQYFEKPLGRRYRREKAIIRKERKAEKLRKMRLGIK